MPVEFLGRDQVDTEPGGRHHEENASQERVRRLTHDTPLVRKEQKKQAKTRPDQREPPAPTPTREIFEKRLSDPTPAFEIDQLESDTRIELGLAYNELGRVEQAIVELRRAIALDPDSPESRLHLPGVIEQLEQSIVGSPLPLPVERDVS